MLKPVEFVKPCNVNGPLYQPGDVAGFMPDLAAALIADGTAREPHTPTAAAPADPPAEVLGTLSGFPHKTSDERQAARKGRR